MCWGYVSNWGETGVPRGMGNLDTASTPWSLDMCAPACREPGTMLRGVVSRCPGKWFVSLRHWFVTQARVCRVEVVAKGYSAGGGCPRLRVRNGLPSFSLGARTPARVMPSLDEPDFLQPSRVRHPRGSQGHCTTSNRSKCSRVLFVFALLNHLTIPQQSHTKKHPQCPLSQ